MISPAPFGRASSLAKEYLATFAAAVDALPAAERAATATATATRLVRLAEDCASDPALKEAADDYYRLAARVSRYADVPAEIGRAA